jgi:glycosyltransferase involved in cell wall biosynthesis
MVQFAINSVITQGYKNWEMVICDDGSDVHIGDVLSEMNIRDSRITIKRLDDTLDDKANVGSRSGMMLNEAMQESDADVAITLCDDDGLFPDALEHLAEFYSNNDVIYSYGLVSIYDPSLVADYRELPSVNTSASLNHGVPVQPSCAVDASQVSWRLNEDTRDLFPYPQTAALDAVVFQRLYDLYSLCICSNIIVQYKGIFHDQLGRRMSAGRDINPIVQ